MKLVYKDATKVFYDYYIQCVGFVMRVVSCQQSEVDGRPLSSRLGCNKDGAPSKVGLLRRMS